MVSADIESAEHTPYSTLLQDQHIGISKAKCSSIEMRQHGHLPDTCEW